MLTQLLCAFALTAVTVIIHGLGTLEAFRHLARVWQRKKEDPGSLVSVHCLLRVVTVLLLLHWLEAGLWAVLYLIIGGRPDLQTPIYVSVTSYTALGYGDVVLPASWRLL